MKTRPLEIRFPRNSPRLQPGFLVRVIFTPHCFSEGVGCSSSQACSSTKGPEGAACVSSCAFFVVGGPDVREPRCQQQQTVARPYFGRAREGLAFRGGPDGKAYVGDGWRPALTGPRRLSRVRLPHA